LIFHADILRSREVSCLRGEVQFAHNLVKVSGLLQAKQQRLAAYR
jgi:hypothetical protein